MGKPNKPSWFSIPSGTPHRAVSVCTYLANRAGGECWSAIPTIASEVKLLQSTVWRTLHDLRKAGLLETEQLYRTKGGGKQSALQNPKRIIAKKIYTFRRGGTIPPRWQVVPAMMTGESELPNLRDTTAERKDGKVLVQIDLWDRSVNTSEYNSTFNLID